MKRKYKRPRTEPKAKEKVVRREGEEKLRPPKEDPGGKTRVALRLDNDVLKWFRRRIHEERGSSIDSLINTVLKDYVEKQ